jgi:hypothetical protein
MKLQAPVSMTVSDSSLDTPEERDPTTFAIIRQGQPGFRTVPAGTWVELPEAEANAIIAKHGAYKPPKPMQEGPRVIRPLDERHEFRF